MTKTSTQSQMDYTKQQLLKKGYISRNECLKKRFTRLTSRISDLVLLEGWKIEPRWIDYGRGRDYVYYNIKSRKGKRAYALGLK